MFLIGLLDAIDTFPEPFPIVPNEIRRLQWLCASRCALNSGICGGSFFSHPDERNVVAKIIVTKVERSVFFMGLTTPRSWFEIEFAFALLIEHAIAS